MTHTGASRRTSGATTPLDVSAPHTGLASLPGRRLPSLYYLAPSLRRHPSLANLPVVDEEDPSSVEPLSCREIVSQSRQHNRAENVL